MELCTKVWKNMQKLLFSLSEITVFPLVKCLLERDSVKIVCATSCGLHFFLKLLPPPEA